MADKTLKSLNFGGADNYFPLPIVSTNDNDNILVVADGEWVAKSPNDITGQYVWSKKDSADGPVTGYVISNDGEKYPDGGWIDGVFYTLELDPRILIGIEITSSPTTVEYTEGDSLDLTGLVVTAMFSDGSTEDVTSQCIFSPSDGTVLATTDTRVGISYTYKGTTLSMAQIIVVESPLPYLSFIGNEDFTLKTYNASKNWNGTLQYSTNGSTWTTWNGTEISSSGSKLYLRGTGNTKITGDSSSYRFVFTGTSALKIACKGNIENLLDNKTVSTGGHPTMADYCYQYMFYNCTALTKAPALPATTLATGCYRFMFYCCKSLTTAPALPATTLAENCYQNMFRDCMSITTAPALPATTLAYGCYQYMFYGCTSLTTAPELPATTLGSSCYDSMFYGCTALTKAPALPATTLANNCYKFMFNGCTSLTTAPELPATTLSSSCYNSMFGGCTKIKMSTTKTGEYQTAYRIPKSGTGTTATSALDYMFYNTGGTFTGTPSINTTYYLSTSNTVV